MLTLHEPVLQCADCGRRYHEARATRDGRGLLHGPCGHPLHRAVYCDPRTGATLCPYNHAQQGAPCPT